jgi:hypothetical protein
MVGNHDLGRQIGCTVQVAYERRLPTETSLEILDRYCAGRGGDAEFEAEDPNNHGHIHPLFNDYRDPCPDAGLGMLMVETFAPNGLSDLPKYHGVMGYKQTGVRETDAALESAAEVSCDLWDKEVCTPFRKRYGFW